jgi:hypothetical protein
MWEARVTNQGTAMPKSQVSKSEVSKSEEHKNEERIPIDLSGALLRNSPYRRAG